MPVDRQPIQRPDWTPLPYEGCFNVKYKSLIKYDRVALAMLRFGQNATIHEHSADIEIDVICLEGHGFTSVGSEQSRHSCRSARSLAGQPHRLWTEESEMITLMVEHS